MKAQQAFLGWLWRGLMRAPAWAELLESWQSQLSDFPEPGGDYQPAPAELELAMWLAGLAGFPEALNRWLAPFIKDEGELKRQIVTAIAREPEPPMDWVRRSLYYSRTWLEQGVTPFGGYYSLRRLHFLTQGATSRLLTALYQAVWPARLPKSLLEEVARGLPAEIERQSYAVWPEVLQPAQVQALQDFAWTTPCYPSLPDRDHRDLITGEYTLPRVLFEPEQPLARRYDFHFAELWQCLAIQEIAADLRWPALVEQVLGSRAVLVQAYLWWSVAFEGPQSRYTGQVFHVDLDRFHFTNCFFYLCDVGLENGPQAYFSGSHRNVPLQLSEDQRWEPEALLAVYGPERLKYVTAPAGSLIAANTQAFHRGEPLKQGYRLMLQFEFAPCTLGENPAPVSRPAQVHPALAARLQAEPWRYPTLNSWLD